MRPRGNSGFGRSWEIYAVVYDPLGTRTNGATAKYGRERGESNTVEGDNGLAGRVFRNFFLIRPQRFRE